jgi:hypothetical protein
MEANMDGSAFRNLKIDKLFWWALFGVVSAGALGLAGTIALIWFITNHVRIV